MSYLEVNDLSKAFGDLKAVDGVNFRVEAGEIYGLLGPNGAGKTTTISMVSGLLKPDAGGVRVDGKDFWSDPIAAQRKIGVVPQEIALYEELSGRENLEFWGQLAGLSKREVRARAVVLLESLNLTERARDPIKKYSGGMKRRINLGCALMHRPKLLLLDEPTVGIDPQARANILSFIKGLVADGTAVLYTTHYLEEAEELCNRIGIIDHGRVLVEGTLEELRKRVGGDQIFVLEGAFDDLDPATWPGFRDHFRVIQRKPQQFMLTPLQQRHPSDCLRELLELPVTVENATVKKPTLNDLFLQLTGRELRE
ncbi:MAG: ABC transporter ATP-binding protein [Opitutaceae bacterium]